MYLSVVSYDICICPMSQDQSRHPLKCEWISEARLLITGGEDTDTQADWCKDTIELFNLESKTSCKVNITLDVPRSGHSGNGDLVCGGINTYGFISTCFNVITGETINMNDPRASHTSWSTKSGVYLLGGKNANGTLESVEIIHTNAHSVQSRLPGFQMKYYTLYVNLKSEILLYQYAV